MATGDNVEEEDWFTCGGSGGGVDDHVATVAQVADMRLLSNIRRRRRPLQDQVQQSNQRQQPARLKLSLSPQPAPVARMRPPCRLVTATKVASPPVTRRHEKQQLQAHKPEALFKLSAMTTSGNNSSCNIKQSVRRRRTKQHQHLITSELSSTSTTITNTEEHLLPPEVARRRPEGKSVLISRCNMWPSWRQVAVLGFLFILITSLLATFNVLPSSSSSSSCLLFNHCHALSVSTTQASAGSRLSGFPAATGTGGGGSSSSSTSTTTTTTSTLNPLLDMTTASTTTAASASINAPTAPSVSTQASNYPTQPASGEAQPGDRSSSTTSLKPHRHHLWSNQLAPSSSSGVGISSQKHQFHQQAKQTPQLTGNPSKTDTDTFVKPAGGRIFGDTNNLKRHDDNNGSPQMQRLLPPPPPPQVNNNYQGAIDSNNNGQSSFSQHQQRVASSISSSQPVVDDVAAQTAPDLSAGRRLSPFEAVASTTPVPTHSSSNGAIKLVASPSFASPTLARQQPQVVAGELGEGWSLTNDSLNETAAAAQQRHSNKTPAHDHLSATPSLDLQNADSRPGSVTPRTQPLPGHQASYDHLRDQFLLSAGHLAMPQSLLHSVVRDALSDFMGQQQPNQRPQLLLQSAPLLPVSLGAVQAAHNRRNLHSAAANNQPQQDNQQVGKAMAASQSAPSISLPPLSHFLVPRNPFRLFSSSSTPIASRYRPFQKTNKQQQQQQSGNSGNSKAASGSGRWAGMRLSSAASEQQNSNSLSNANNQNTHNNINLDLRNFRLPASAFQGSSSFEESPASLYAHSHSAEQLERLVRAASQATGVHTPILPAIVSAPSGGAFPGFYIPAIESDSEESQVNELRHGEQATISSKIPGTDYILHPDEVRTMINIGELAWRQRQAGIGNQQVAASSNESPYQQVAADSSRSEEVSQDWQSFGQRNQRPTQLMASMRENHAENIRDFAYVDQPPQQQVVKNDNFQSQSSTNNQQQQQHQQQPRQYTQNNLNSSDLESHLANHFKQQQVNSFPAIIRVNDQDYVHWPLIKPNKKQQQEQQQAASGQVEQQTASGRAPDKAMFNVHQFQAQPTLYQTSYPREHLFAIAAAHPSQISQAYAPVFSVPSFSNQAVAQQRPWLFNPPVGRHLNQQQQIMSAASAPQNLRTSGKSVAGTDFDHSPVRLATQLTPNEVRQVEDSIIEALIMSQSVQHQRKLMQGIAASQSRFGPNARNHNNNNNNHNNNANNNGISNNGNGQKGYGNSRLRNALFGRRRRRQSSTTKNQQPAQQVAAAESAVPVLNISGLAPAVHIIAPLIPFGDVQPVRPVVAPGMLIDPQESVVFESKVAPSKRLPVVLADQETNKPSLSIDSSSDSLAEASSPAVTVLQLPSSLVPQAPVAHPPKSTLFTAADQMTSASETQVTYGSRVPRTKLANSSTGSGLALVSQRAELSQKQASGELLPPAQRVSIIRTHTPQVNSKPSSTGDPPAASGHRARHHDVDWPAMVSDADYFPSGKAQEQEQQQPVAAARGASIHDSSSSSSSTGAQQQQQQVSQESRLHSDSRRRPQRSNRLATSASAGRPAQSVKNFVQSQLKLQFAQDYQAREGVPIYNNNVRVAGALDRQRLIEADQRNQVRTGGQRHRAAASEASPTDSTSSGSSVGGGGGDDEGDDADESDDDQSSPGDLQQRAASQVRAVEKSQPAAKATQHHLRPSSSKTR